MTGREEKTARRKRRVRRMLLTLPVFLAVFLLGFFFLTGSFFLTEVALPFVSGRVGVEIAAEHLDWSPFRSAFRVRKLRVGPAAHPYFTADTASGIYSLRMLRERMPILSQVHADGAELTLYHGEDGHWRVSSAIPERVPDEAENAAKEPRPFRIDLGDVKLRNSRFRLIYGDPDAGSAFELSGLSLDSARFANGEKFQLTGSGNLRLSSSRANHIDTGKMELSLDSRLSAELIPEQVNLNAVFASLFGSVSGEPFNDGALSLQLEMEKRGKALEIDRLTFVQSQGGKQQSETTLSGKIGFSPFEFQAAVQKLELSEEASSLLFDLLFDFNPGRAGISYQGDISYVSGRFAATGTLYAERSGDAIIGLERIALPPMRIDGVHDFEIDLAGQSVDLRKFSLRLADRSREVASLVLRSPVKYTWQNEAEAGGRRIPFDLVCDQFDLRLLRFLIPGNSKFQFDSGYFSTRMQLLLRNQFSTLSILGSGKISDSHCRWRGRSFELAELSVGLDGELQRSFDFTLRNLSLGFRNEQSILGNANFQGEGTLTDLSAKLSGKLEQLSPELAVWIFPSFAPFLPEWRKLGFGTGEVNFSLESKPGSNGISTRSFTAALNREGKHFLKLETGEFRFDPRNGMPAGEVKFHLKGELPAETFNPYLASRNIILEEGKVKLSVEGSLSRNYSSALLQGDLTFEEFAARVDGRAYRNVSGQCAFNCYLPSSSILEFRALNFYVRRAGKPALRLECPGIWEIDAGNYSGEWAIRYLNEQLLALIDPKLAAEAHISGAIRVVGRESFRTVRVGGAIELGKWLPPDSSETPLSGAFSFNAEKSGTELTLRRSTLMLRQGKNPHIAEVEVAGRAEIDRPDGPVNLRLTIPRLDLYRLLNFMPIRPEEEEPEQPGEIPPPQLQFGTHPINLLCSFDKIRLSPDLLLGLDTQLQFRPGMLLADSLRLQLNNSRYNGSLKGVNQEKGILWDIALRGFDQLEISPLLKLIRDNGQQSPGSGKLNELDLTLQLLADGQPDTPGNSVSGSLQMGMEDLELSNAIENSQFGRLLLFPVDLLAELDKMLPGNVAAWKRQVLDSNSLKKQVRSVHFDRGRIRLKADKGKLKIEECALFGDWVSRLLFSGDLELSGEQKLELSSTVNVHGIQTTIPIRGTLANPLVELDAVAAGTLSELWKKLSELNVIGFSADPGDGEKSEPVIMIDKLPSAGTVRKLYRLFQEMWD